MSHLASASVNGRDRGGQVLNRTCFLQTFCCFRLMELFNRIPVVGRRIASLAVIRARGSSITRICRRVIDSLGLTVKGLPISGTGNQTRCCTTGTLLNGICLRVTNRPLRSSRTTTLTRIRLGRIVRDNHFRLIGSCFDLFSTSGRCDSRCLFSIRFTGGNAAACKNRIKAVSNIRAPGGLC